MTDLDNTAAVVADHYLGNISEDKEIAIRLSQAQQQNNESAH